MITESQAAEILKLQKQICFPLYATSRLIIQSYSEGLEKLKITYPQYLVLLVLWENDGLSVKEIGDLLFLDSGTLTPVLKKMNASGLVVRKRSKQDDRYVLNFLTTKAQRLKLKAAEMSYDLFCRSGLKPDSAVALRQMLHSLLPILLHLNGSTVEGLNSKIESRGIDL
jgi:MarR family transcriptional regulator, organic hydroperoxide resistance regulator